MDGNVDLLQGLVMHKEAISEEFERELISFVQTQVRPRYGLLLVMCSIFIVIHSHDMGVKPVRKGEERGHQETDLSESGRDKIPGESTRVTHVRRIFRFQQVGPLSIW